MLYRLQDRAEYRLSQTLFDIGAGATPEAKPCTRGRSGNAPYAPGHRRKVNDPPTRARYDGDGYGPVPARAVRWALHSPHEGG